jgi:hypothetical protein
MLSCSSSFAAVYLPRELFLSEMELIMTKVPPDENAEFREQNVPYDLGTRKSLDRRDEVRVGRKRRQSLHSGQDDSTEDGMNDTTQT